MRCCCRNTGRSAGFTLIEVLIALAIAGLVLAAVAAVFGTGVAGQETASDANTALALAEEKLAAAEAVSLVKTGRSGGDYGGRFEWQVAVSRYDDPGEKDLPAADALASQPAGGALQLYRIDAVVAWRDGRRRRELALSTVRLLPAPP